MKYITIIAKTYEDALKKAREQYGESLRIHSRKDFDEPGFMGIGKVHKCELTCFVSDSSSEIKKAKEAKEEEKLLKRFEQEAKTPSPEEVQNAQLQKQIEIENAKEKEITPFLERAEDILKINEFSKEFTQKVLSEIKQVLIKALPVKPDRKQLELLILDKISACFEIDYQTQSKPPKCAVILGTTGTGKTTTVAKISAIYGSLSANKGDVRIITLDSFRIGAYEQIESFGKSLGVPVYRADDKESFASKLEECKDADLILVDTIGKSPRDGYLAGRLDSLLEECPKEETRFFVAVNASMKANDIEMALNQFDNYDITSIIITKVDETYAVGNIISICSKKKLPVLYVTDGQKVPSDIHRATNSYLLSLLKGITVDLTQITTRNTGK